MHFPCKFTAMLAALSAAIAASEAAADGILEGRLISEHGIAQYQGAVIRIEELKRETLVGQGGRFRLPGLAAGVYTLTVSLGQQRLQQHRVNISDEQTTYSDIQLNDDVRLEQVLVIGQAAQLQRALDRQRYADNLVNAINADAIGQLPDSNAAEALQRIPGISIERDQGEGRFVRVRGISPELNAVTVNGTQLPAAQAGRRAVALDVLPADLISSLVVSKALTADMDANAIGGSIEVESLSALDRDGLFYTLRGEASYDDMTEQTSPAYAISGGNTFEWGAHRSLGIASAFSYDQHKFGSDNIETGASWVFEDKTAALQQLEQRDYSIERERLGAALNIDFQLNSQHIFFWRSLYSSFRDDERRLANSIEFGELISRDDEPGQFEFENKARRPGETGLAEVKRELKHRQETQQIVATSLGGEHYLGAWTVEYALAYSQADEDEPNSIDGAVFSQQNLAGMGFYHSRKPRLITSSGYIDANVYQLDEIEYSESLAKDSQYSVQLDVSRDLFIGHFPVLLKAGIKATEREKNQDVEQYLFQDFSEHGVGAEQLLLSHYASSSPDYSLGRFGPGISESGIRSILTALNKDDFYNEQASRVASYDIDEQIHAAYLMGRIEINNWLVLGGLRYEATQQEFSGTQLNPDEQLARIIDKQQYSHNLPSLHLRYEWHNDTQLRMSWSNAVVRPTFEQMSPSFVDKGDEAELGNTQLNAMQASNIDMSLEHYMDSTGALSVGLFYKDIDDFIFATDLAGSSERWQDYDQVASYRNGNTASIKGLELAYSQKMSQLPAPFDGLLVAANITWSDSHAEILSYQQGEASRRTIDLPNQSDVTGNLVIGYEKNGLMLRLASNYKSDYLLAVEDLTSSQGDIYQSAHMQIDVSSAYNINDQLKISFDISNLGDEPYYSYQHQSRYNAQYEEYGPTYRIGLSYSHF